MKCFFLDILRKHIIREGVRILTLVYYIVYNSTQQVLYITAVFYFLFLWACIVNFIIVYYIHAKSILVVQSTKCTKDWGHIRQCTKIAIAISRYTQHTPGDYLKEAPFPKKATTVRSTAYVFVSPRVSVAPVVGTTNEKHIKWANHLSGTRTWLATWHFRKTTSGFIAPIQRFHCTSQKRFHHFPYIAASSCCWCAFSQRFVCYNQRAPQ